MAVVFRIFLDSFDVQIAIIFINRKNEKGESA